MDSSISIKTLEDYAASISDEEPQILKELNRETHQKVLQPKMLSGHLQGRVLSLISKLLRPKNILEIGTFTGYSALCLAEGMHADGKLHTIDINEELYNFQKKYFDRSDFADQIIQHTGKATDIIPNLKENFDLVFIDADKDNYGKYFDLVFPKMNKGGVFISDNVLWYGKVTQPTKKGDKETEALKKYNQKLKEDNRVENVLLPIRDGLLISKKK
ncbi:MAG TPA: O-methyltransferase [Flavobacteriaceae bacterium]|nr:O-methyltransferase [Flavobacteriaceae bacterium]